MHRGAALIALAVAAATGAAAAPAPEPMGEAARALVGTWEFTNADRDRTCAVTFHADAAAVGLKVEFDAACAKLYPFLGEVAGWRMAEHDFLRLLNERDQTILDFSEVESDVYEAPRPGEGILFIQRPGAGGPPPRTAEQAAGEYALVRGNKVLCVLVLSATPAGAELAVQVRAPCDAAVAGFAPATWQLEGGELLLANVKGAVWRFEEEGDAAWRRVPQADGLMLVRR